MLTIAVLVAVAATSKPDSDAKPVREPAPVTRRAPAPPPPPRRVMPMPILRAATHAPPSGTRIGVPIEPRRPNPAPIAQATSAPIYSYQNPQPSYNYIPIYYYVPIYEYFGYNGFNNGYNGYSYGSYPSIANYSAELQGYIIAQQGNSLIVETPSQQLVMVDATYVLGGGYSRYRFMQGQFIDLAGYYYGNEFVATALF